MIYGTLPFSGTTEKEIVKNITTKKLKFNDPKKKISPKCAQLIASLLAKNPKERIKMDDIYQSAWYVMPYVKLDCCITSKQRGGDAKIRRGKSERS